MKDYAISQGVPSYDIFCDHAGFSTYESMYRAKHVFGAERIVVATQTYHLYRALYAAQGLGLDSLGVASDYHDYSKQLQYDLREIPARTKDFFKTLFKVPSTFGRPHQPRSVRRRHRGLTGSVRGASGARDSHASSATAPALRRSPGRGRGCRRLVRSCGAKPIVENPVQASAMTAAPSSRRRRAAVTAAC
ncbi:MAG: vancomycin high temperature exclusion protein [Eggerthellaceae bacterium]